MCKIKLNSVSIFILLSFIFMSFSVAANAVSEESVHYRESVELEDIPVFMTVMEGTIDLSEEQKNVISNVIDRYYQSGSSSTIVNNLNHNGIVLLTNDQKNSLRNSPIYAQLFNNIANIIDSGAEVKYVNIFSTVSTVNELISGNTSSGDLNDPSYWESICPYLGSYNGYKFLYVESAVGVETSEVSPANLSPSWNWDTIAMKTLQVLVNHYVKDVFYQSVSAVTNGLSTVFNIYENPLKITYGASEGYVRAKVSGDVYVRTVLIRDDLDRVQGYAYYNWGITERFVAVSRVHIKYPYKRNASGTYDYRYPSYTFPAQQSYTPGYYGNSAFFTSVISLYNNPYGYFTHNEHIDINSAVTFLLG